MQATTLAVLLIVSSLITTAKAGNPLLKPKPERLEAYSYKCKDYFRRPVLNVRNDTLNDVAFSDMMRMGGMIMGPMIIFNSKRLKTLTKASQKFFLAHECGHHVLGHLYFRRIGHAAEQEADCYAIRHLIRIGQFTIKDIEDVQGDMRKYGQASLYHKNGEERASALTECME